MTFATATACDAQMQATSTHFAMGGIRDDELGSVGGAFGVSYCSIEMFGPYKPYKPYNLNPYKLYKP